MKKSFEPKTLPLSDINWEQLVPLISEANQAIARYDGRLEGIPNPQVLLSPLLTQEAVLSSKIEGTQATLEEVLEFEANPKKTKDKKEDIEEILNYRISLSLAKDELDKRPLCLNLIKDIHSILLQGVRGQNKSRGEFRKSQNWIGKPGTPIEQAMYVPPPPDKLLDYLSNWEYYCHFEEKDSLVQLAIIHAQFEIIHPFLDGNGRIGRILIPLFLYEKKILSSPMFYISAYFEANREEYYSRLLEISEHDNWNDWITYFLKAIKEQASKNSQKAKEILLLYNEMKERIAELTRSIYAIKILDFIFDRPFFTTSLFASEAQIPKASIARLVTQLEQGGIIETAIQGKGRSPTVHMFNHLLKIVGI